MPFSTLIGHEGPKKLLKASILHDRVAHAYLFFGENRIGKRLAAIRFAQALNCETAYGPDGPDACGACRSCHQIENGTHPDCFVIEPDREKATPQIKIEQIRDLEQHIIYRPLIGHRKVCLIDDADCMTLSAANSLLKTLEEPPSHSVFLLITSRPAALPATVRSRCQSLRFTPPTPAQVEAALILQRELPPDDAKFLMMVTEARIGEALDADLPAIRAEQQTFAALTSRAILGHVPQILAMAETLAKGDRASDALQWIARWIRDLVLIQIGAEPTRLLNDAAIRDVQQIGEAVSLEALLDLQEAIEGFQRRATRHLNLQLVLETVLLRLGEALGFQPRAHAV